MTGVSNGRPAQNVTSVKANVESVVVTSAELLAKIRQDRLELLLGRNITECVRELSEIRFPCTTRIEVCFSHRQSWFLHH